jgi:DNA-binding XRE family transcriptional regulator
MTPNAKVSNRQKGKMDDLAESKPVGRPTKYQPEFAEQARKLCLLGSTDVQLAEFFGVSEQTINNWKHEFPEFFESIKQAKLNADSSVAESLYKRAIGCSHKETHVSSYRGEVILTEVTKHYPPDTAAAFIWLKNRQPELWRDRVEAKSDVAYKELNAEALDAKFGAAMAKARERMAVVLAERGLLKERNIK